jgi:hypothetical protein
VLPAARERAVGGTDDAKVWVVRVPDPEEIGALGWRDVARFRVSRAAVLLPELERLQLLLGCVSLLGAKELHVLRSHLWQRCCHSELLLDERQFLSDGNLREVNDEERQRAMLVLSPVDVWRAYSPSSCAGETSPAALRPATAHLDTALLVTHGASRIFSVDPVVLAALFVETREATLRPAAAHHCTELAAGSAVFVFGFDPDVLVACLVQHALDGKPLFLC